MFGRGRMLRGPPPAGCARPAGELAIGDCAIRSMAWDARRRVPATESTLPRVLWSPVRAAISPTRRSAMAMYLGTPYCLAFSRSQRACSPLAPACPPRAAVRLQRLVAGFRKSATGSRIRGRTMVASLREQRRLFRARGPTGSRRPGLAGRSTRLRQPANGGEYSTLKLLNSMALPDLRSRATPSQLRWECARGPRRCCCA